MGGRAGDQSQPDTGGPTRRRAWSLCRVWQDRALLDGPRCLRRDGGAVVSGMVLAWQPRVDSFCSAPGSDVARWSSGTSTDGTAGTAANHYRRGDVDCFCPVLFALSHYFQLVKKGVSCVDYCAPSSH